MKSRIRLLLGLAIAVLPLTAGDCLTTAKDLEVVIHGNADFTFHPSGAAGTHSGSATVDFAPILHSAFSDLGPDSVVSVSVENAYWHVTRNNGDASTRVTGGIQLDRLGTAAAPKAAVDLIPPTSIMLGNFTGDFVPAPLSEAGVGLLNTGFIDYVDSWNMGSPINSLNYRFDWSVTSSEAVDFQFDVKVKFTAVGKQSVDVPNL